MTTEISLYLLHLAMKNALHSCLNAHKHALTPSPISREYIKTQQKINMMLTDTSRQKRLEVIYGLRVNKNLNHML